MGFGGEESPQLCGIWEIKEKVLPNLNHIENIMEEWTYPIYVLYLL